MATVVTGATGRLGRLIVEGLLSRGVAATEIVATGRSVEKLSDLAARGVRIVPFDYSDVPDGVLSPGDVVVLVSGNEVGQRVAQHGSVVDAAARAGVQRLIYTSAPAADDTTLVLAPEHAATEQLVRDSGLTYTFLRNGWYSENYQPTFEQAAQTGVVLSSAAQGRVASAAIADYAEAAAAVASTSGHDNAVYELSGDVAWTFDDLAKVISEVLGREVVYRPLTPEQHRDTLVEAGLDDGTAGFVVALDQNIAEGLLGITTGDLTKLIGRPTTPLVETVRAWA